MLNIENIVKNFDMKNFKNRKKISDIAELEVSDVVEASVIKPNDMSNILADETLDPYADFKKEYPNKSQDWYEGYEQGKSDGYCEGYEEAESDFQENDDD